MFALKHMTNIDSELQIQIELNDEEQHEHGIAGEYKSDKFTIIK